MSMGLLREAPMHHRARLGRGVAECPQNGSPHGVMVLAIPCRNDGIGETDINHGQEQGIVPEFVALGRGNLSGNDIVKARRCTRTGTAIVGPKITNMISLDHHWEWGRRPCRLCVFPIP